PSLFFQGLRPTTSPSPEEISIGELSSMGTARAFPSLFFLGLLPTTSPSPEEISIGELSSMGTAPDSPPLFFLRLFAVLAGFRTGLCSSSPPEEISNICPAGGNRNGLLLR